MELEPNQIEVGKQYQMTEPPYYQAIVTILTDDSKGKWVGWKIRIESSKGQMTPLDGAEISVGWNTDYRYLAPIYFEAIEEGK